MVMLDGSDSLPVLTAVRYVQPLREGGSLPAIVDTREGGLFVAKFRGAGQGVKALIAELIVGLLASEAGLAVPQLVLIDIPDSFGQSEPDPEIQDLLRASHGMNIGMRYLDGAFNFDVSAAGELVSPERAAQIVWLDAFVTNPDRTHRNPNILVWERQPWLIDHGAALYAQHDWPAVDEIRTRAPFPHIRSHVLLGQCGDLEVADATITRAITDESIIRAVSAVPDSMLTDSAVAADFATPEAARVRYVTYLTSRLRSPRAFLSSAIEARDQAGREVPQRVSSRR